MVWTRSGCGHYEAISETPQLSSSNNNNIQQNDLNHISWPKVSTFSKPIALQFKSTNWYKNDLIHLSKYTNKLITNSVNGMSENSANDKICQVCKQNLPLIII